MDAAVIKALGAPCPRLGLAEDRFTHALFATEAHRCYAGRTRQPSVDRQESLCLSGDFFDCARFMADKLVRQ